jgi:hypothetical protein
MIGSVSIVVRASRARRKTVTSATLTYASVGRKAIGRSVSMQRRRRGRTMDKAKWFLVVCAVDTRSLYYKLLDNEDGVATEVADLKKRVTGPIHVFEGENLKERLGNKSVVVETNQNGYDT